MRVTVWGCRGTLATPGEATVRYGGNTSSVAVRTGDGALIVLDAGTGIRRLGLSLEEEPHRAEIHLLLTHMHLDHVEGLGFFAPLRDPGCTVTIWGPRPGNTSLRDHIASYLSPPLYPHPFEQLPAQIEFVEIERERWNVDGAHITAARVRHPGPTLGYRIESGGRTLAFIPDNEPGLDPTSGAAIAEAADLLIHDAQYTEAEYETRCGWGHTALPHFAAVVAEANPARTLMFHHDPAHSDAVLERMEATARELAGRDDITLAHEGLELTL